MKRSIGEQIDPHLTGPGASKFRKRVARKKMRQLGKTLKDDAPKKYTYRGYDT